MLCIVYMTVAGAVMAVFGVAAERLMPNSWPRRWLWCAVIVVSLILPGYYRSYHNIPVGSAGAVAGTSPSRTSVPGPLAVLNADWWVDAESYDPVINALSKYASLLLILWAAVIAIRVSLLVRVSRRRKKAGGFRVVNGVEVIVTDSIGPATAGFWRPRVLVPHWVLALPGPQRRYVIRHEEEHRAAHDARILFAASLLLVLAPWNLALWWQLRRLHLAIEMDCDNRVVAALGDAPSYGELLVNVAQAASRGPRLQPALLGGIGSLERRLNALVSPAQPRLAEKIALSLTACALLALFIAMPHPVAAHGTHTHSVATAKR